MVGVARAVPPSVRRRQACCGQADRRPPAVCGAVGAAFAPVSQEEGLRAGVDGAWRIATTAPAVGERLRQGNSLRASRRTTTVIAVPKVPGYAPGPWLIGLARLGPWWPAR